jgi:hypothetical protein
LYYSICKRKCGIGMCPFEGAEDVVEDVSVRTLSLLTKSSRVCVRLETVECVDNRV